MYEEDEVVDLDGLDMQFCYAETDNADLGLGDTASKEEVTEHNRDFEVTILKENTNNVKRKVETVEEDVKGVANKVVDVEGKVKQVDEQLANLTAQIEEMKEYKTKETDIFQGSEEHLFDLVDTANKEMETNKNKEIEDIATKAAQKVLEGTKKPAEISTENHNEGVRNKKKNPLLTGFQTGVETGQEFLGRLVGTIIIIAVLVLLSAIASTLGYYLFNTTVTPPENIAPIIEAIRPGWNWLLDSIGNAFTKLTNK